jgi:DedD protein
VDRQLQQRVVGAAVLVAVGVILIPIFLDNGALDTRIPKVSNIPAAPEGDYTSRVIPLSEDAIDDLEAKTIQPIVVPEMDTGVEEEKDSAQSAVVATPAPSGGKDDGADGIADSAQRTGVIAWTIQLGSFANDENAKRLIDKLREAGFPAYLERQVDPAGTAFKVRVGPEIRREDAEKLRVNLEKKFALKGMLLRYQ